MPKVVRRGGYDEYRPDDNERFYEAMPGTMQRPYAGYVEPEEVVERPAAVVEERSYAAQIIYFVAGLVEALLALRLVFNLIGASLSNDIVSIVYILTAPLVRPFAGILNLPANNFTARFDAATAVAMIMYAVIALLLVQLVRAIHGRRVG